MRCADPENCSLNLLWSIYFRLQAGTHVFPNLLMSLNKFVAIAAIATPQKFTFLLF